MKESLKEDTFEAEKVTLAKADFNDLMEDTASSAFFRPSVAVTERDSLAEPSVSTRRRRVRKGSARWSAAAPEVQSMLMNAVAALEEQGSIEDMTDAQLQAAIDGAIRTSDAPETLRRQLTSGKLGNMLNEPRPPLTHEGSSQNVQRGERGGGVWVGRRRR